jgi:hypothetical protein
MKSSGSSMSHSGSRPIVMRGGRKSVNAPLAEAG